MTGEKRITLLSVATAMQNYQCNLVKMALRHLMIFGPHLSHCACYLTILFAVQYHMKDL